MADLKYILEDIKANPNSLAGGSDISILLLDENLTLKQFTSPVTNIFDLVKSDIGKPLSQVIDYNSFEKLKTQAQHIFKKSPSQEIEPHSQQFSDKFLSHILPYRNRNGSVTGAIVIFEEITENKILKKNLTTRLEKLENKIEQRNHKIKKLKSELISAKLKERKRISKLLHTDVQQYLFRIKTELDLLKDEVPSNNVNELDKLLEYIDVTLTLTKQLVSNMNPPDFKQNNLQDGINWIVKQMHELHGLTTEVQGVNTVKLTSKKILIYLLPMIHEILFNIIKHTEVKAAKIYFEEVGDALHIHIVDKGRGLRFLNEKYNNDRSSHFGLSQIKQELNQLGGNLIINSSPGKGTDICISIPAKKHTQNKIISDQITDYIGINDS